MSNQKQTNNSFSLTENLNGKKVKLFFYTAFEIQKETIEKIIKLVSKKYNFIASSIEVILDPSLIGGIKLEFDSIVVDGSIQGKLRAIKEKSEERI